MMNATRPSVHPVEAQTADGAAENPMLQGRMDDIPGMAGTRGGLTLRLNQFAFALISLCFVVSTNVSLGRTYAVFHYLAGAVSFQCLWSLSLAVVDLYAILVKRSLRNPKLLSVFAIGDGISSTITFAAASASAGVTVYLGHDITLCSEGYCHRYQASVAMAFLAWFAVSPSFILNFWTLASK